MLGQASRKKPSAHASGVRAKRGPIPCSFHLIVMTCWINRRGGAPVTGKSPKVRWCRIYTGRMWSLAILRHTLSRSRKATVVHLSAKRAIAQAEGLRKRVDWRVPVSMLAVLFTCGRSPPFAASLNKAVDDGRDQIASRRHFLLALNAPVHSSLAPPLYY